MTFYEALAEIATDMGVNYLQGSFKEIEQRLIEQMQEGVTDRFPLLCLITPITQTDNYEVTHVENVELILVTDTEQNYSTQERITNVYTPILWPLYELFKDEALVSRYLNIQGEPIEYVDYFFYSNTLAKDQNKFAGLLDAITFKLNFKLIKNC